MKLTQQFKFPSEISSELFGWLLEFEKKRCLRTNSSVCLAKFDFSSTKPISLNGKLKIQNIWQRIVHTMKLNIRSSDCLCVTGYEIKVIFTNTTKNGALVAIQRIAKAFQETKVEFLPYEEVDRFLPFKAQLTVWDYNEKIIYNAIIKQNLGKLSWTRSA